MEKDRPVIPPVTRQAGLRDEWYLASRLFHPAAALMAVCGQLAGDADAVPLLVGLGVRELSVAPARIPIIKKLLSTLTLSEMQARTKSTVVEVV